MRTTIVAIAAGAALVVSFAVGLTDCRAAGANPVPPAPVGHRQPTAADVPTKDENSADSAMKKMDQDLDRKLKSICKGC